MTGMEKLNELIINDGLHEDSKVITNENFSNMDFQNDEIKWFKFIDCDFNNANFKNASLKGNNFQNCNFENCNFEKADIDRPIFSDCNFDNANFVRTIIDDVGPPSEEEEYHFNNCSFRSAYFSSTRLAGLSINNANFHDASFDHTALIFTNIENSDFQAAKLQRVSCERSTISNSNLKDAYLPESNDLYHTLILNNPKLEIIRDIQGIFFGEAYSKILNSDNNIQESLRGINFMKEVVKQHGTDMQMLSLALNAVTEYENKSPAFMAKLLNDTLKTEEYKKAFEAEQGKEKVTTR